MKSLPIIDKPAAAVTGTRLPVTRRDKFIKQFEGPGYGSGVVCFKFWELVPAWGCPYECSYCFLQTNPHVRFNEDALSGQLYSNWRHMLDEVDVWLTARTPRMMIVGELQDGLVFDSEYQKMTGKPLTHHLIPLFAGQDRHKLIFLTKSALVSHALKLEPTPQVIFSWSVNAEYVSRRWEHGTPSSARRFDAAKKMKGAGWTIRFRLDPMIPYEDKGESWREGYAAAIDRINNLEPEMVTIGALRASNKKALQAAAENNGRPAELFDYLTEKDPSGFKYRLPFDRQVEMFRFALERLDQRRIVPALCKEDISVWQALGLKFGGCHCLLSGPDVPHEIVSSRSFLKVLPETTRD